MEPHRMYFSYIKTGEIINKIILEPNPNNWQISGNVSVRFEFLWEFFFFFRHSECDMFAISMTRTSHAIVGRNRTIKRRWQENCCHQMLEELHVTATHIFSPILYPTLHSMQHENKRHTTLSDAPHELSTAGWISSFLTPLHTSSMLLVE